MTRHNMIRVKKINRRLKKKMKKMLTARNTSQGLVFRIKTILEATTQTISVVAQVLETTYTTVMKWVTRWNAALNELVKAAAKGKKHQKALEYLIVDVLGDALRSGAPPTFKPEQVAQIIQLACTPPESAGYPFTHWTTQDLADATVQKEIVDSISRSTIHRILNGNDLKPHQVKEWLNATPEDVATFLPRVKTLTHLYMKTPDLEKDGTHVVCMDEKMGIKAIEPLHPTLGMKPGLVERREQFYRRNGTSGLIGSFEVATGRIIHATIQPTRTEPEFLDHVKQTIAVDLGAKWIIVVDQLNTHKSESLVRYVVAECGIEMDLGIKGRRGILKNMVTRAEFLEDELHRIRFVYTPKHCSWLNQIECWFSILSRKALIRGIFTSVADLEWKIKEFIDYHNEMRAKPFRWTYTGRPLAVA